MPVAGTPAAPSVRQPIDQSPDVAPLVATRLHAPPLPTKYVARDRVAAILTRGAAESCRLTLVSAPPGYGKSVAVRGWLTGDIRPYAWLTLDAAADDPVRLVRYLLAAFEQIRPGMGAGTASLLGVRGLPGSDVVAATLLDDVGLSEAPAVVVLDDYHLLSPGESRGLVRRLVKGLPPFIQIVLVTREDPDLPLARLRAYAQIVELRANDLRYTCDEAAALLAALGLGLRRSSVEVLTERVEGWAAGLQLAALMLRGRADADALIADFRGSHRYVIDYLADEVMARLPDELQRFLERTSIADRLSAGLADALTGSTEGARTLREVEQRNLFLLPLDVGRTWYRYHHLFADYLRSRLDPVERQELELRAAQWLSAHGFAVEATQCALASERWPAALPIVLAGSRRALETGEPDAVLGWTDAMPASTVTSCAELLADRAWAAFLTARLPTAAACARELERLDREEPLRGAVAGRAAAIRAWLAVTDGRPAEGRRLGSLALGSLEGDAFFRCLALLALADACWDLGLVGEAAAAIGDAIHLTPTDPPTFATYFAAYTYALAADEQARRTDAERLCRGLRPTATDAADRIVPAAGPIRVGLGVLAYEANDLETASTELEAGFAMCRRLGVEPLLTAQSRWARAMALCATAGADAARRAAEDGMAAAREVSADVLLPEAEAIAALVALRTGEAGAAVRWAEGVLADPRRRERSTPLVRLHRDLTVVRVLLAKASTARAEALVVEVARSAERAGSALGQVEAGILAACAAEQAGRRAEARSRLAEAVGLAAPGGYVRRFVEDGRSIAHLLPTVRTRTESFVDAVMEALEAEAVRVAPGRSATGPAWRAEGGLLLELLTQRELDVLRQLARGRSNAAIADALGMSAGTAKWHVANLLGKLGASSRTQAAARAHELALV